ERPPIGALLPPVAVSDELLARLNTEARRSMPGSELAETQLKANDHHVRKRIDGVHRAGPGRLGRPRHRRAGGAVDRPTRSRGLRVARAPDRTRPDHASALARG